MKKRTFIHLISGWLLLLLLISLQLNAQISPKERTTLNYRLIGFSFPVGQSGSTYKIEIASGNFSNEDSFLRNIIISFPCDSNKTIGEVPSFGAQYTWRYVTNTNQKIISPLYHFSTLTNQDVDSSVTRLRITKPAEKYKDAYVIMDGAKTIYDMNGKPVWFLPEIDGMPKNPAIMICDLSLTGSGTMTFLTNRQNGNIYEVDGRGTILWKGPNNGLVSGDTTENYHHEFTRLANGHYMVMGNEHLSWRLPGTVKKEFLEQPGNRGKITIDSATNNFYENMDFGTVIEYNQTGDVIWSWKCAPYFKNADVFSSVSPNGTFYVQDVHANSFYFDEKRQVLYLSFKNMSRILKIKYPEGDVLNVYGWKFDRRHKGYGPDQFSYQHSIHVSEDGSLYLFNNNARHPGAPPSLVVLRQPTAADDTLEKIWEYQCTTENFDTSIKELPTFTALGSIFELPDHSMFACMSSFGYTKVFIVNQEKRILWSAMPERWNIGANKWFPLVQYRAGIIIDRKNLEQLIWNSEKDHANNK